MNPPKAPKPLVKLERIGPTEPVVRELATEIGVLTVNYAQLERHIRQTIDTVIHIEQAGVIQLPAEFHAVHHQPGKRTLGRLNEELKALGVEEKLRMALGQVNADRIKSIHGATELIIEGTDQVNYPAIHRERVRLRRVLKQVRSVYTGIEQAEIEMFEVFLDVGRAKHGIHPKLVEVEAKLAELKAHHAIRQRQNPAP